MSNDSPKGNSGKRKAEVLKKLVEIIDRRFTEEDLEMLASRDPGHYDYLTDGFDTHCQTRIVPHIPGRHAQARA